MQFYLIIITENDIKEKIEPKLIHVFGDVFKTAYPEISLFTYHGITVK
jgi:hypothetical protein